jgi:hypothetical protein
MQARLTRKGIKQGTQLNIDSYCFDQKQTIWKEDVKMYLPSLQGSEKIKISDIDILLVMEEYHNLV